MAKTWLITGSTRGFGLELAKAALDGGDNVVATARRPELLDELATKYGDRVRTFALDVTDPAAARAAVQTAVDAFGTLDVVVNNAGYANTAPIEEMADDDFRAQIETNLFGVVNVTKAALPVLHRQRSGHFIQFSSIGGRVGGSPGLAAYQTAKYGVEGFSEVLNNEVKPFGVKVTIVEPADSDRSSAVSAIELAKAALDGGRQRRWPTARRPEPLDRRSRSSTATAMRHRLRSTSPTPAAARRGRGKRRSTRSATLRRRGQQRWLREHRADRGHPRRRSSAPRSRPTCSASST